LLFPQISSFLLLWCFKSFREEQAGVSNAMFEKSFSVFLGQLSYFFSLPLKRKGRGEMGRG